MESELLIFCSRQSFQMWEYIGFSWVIDQVCTLEICKQLRLILTQTFVHLLKCDHRATLLGTTITEPIEHEEVKLLPAWSPHAYILVFLVWEATPQDTSRDIWTSMWPQTLHL